MNESMKRYLGRADIKSDINFYNGLCIIKDDIKIMCSCYGQYGSVRRNLKERLIYFRKWFRKAGDDEFSFDRIRRQKIGGHRGAEFKFSFNS
jgi:hypothetical protein